MKPEDESRETGQEYIRLCRACADKWNQSLAEDDDPLWYDNWCAECAPRIRASRLRDARAGIEQLKPGCWS